MIRNLFGYHRNNSKSMENMKGNQVSMLPQDHDEMDRADNRRPINQFNNPRDLIPAGHNQHTMLHSNAFGNLPIHGPNAPTFGFNNNNPAHFNPPQGPKSAPPMPSQSGSMFFNMPAHDLNAIVQEQNQSSPNLFAMPYQDLMALLQGQDYDANDIFDNGFSDHVTSPETAPAAFRHYLDVQGGINYSGHGDSHGAASHLSISSQGQLSQPHGQPRMQSHALNDEFNEQNSLAQQMNTGVLRQHQDTAHSLDGHSNESKSTSGNAKKHAGSAQSIANRLLPGSQSPTLAVESSIVSRGRLHSVLSELQTPTLAPPRSGNIQHSPPQRAFHSPMTPNITTALAKTGVDTSITNSILSPALTVQPMPPMPLPMTRASTSDAGRLGHGAAREALIQQRLVMAEYLKKLNLQCYKSSSEERNTLVRDLITGWGRPDANDNLKLLYAGEMRLMEVNKLWDKYARGFRMCQEEIEELWGDLVVPNEQRLPGEGVFR